MKKSTLYILLLSIGASSGGAQAQVGTPKWPFANRQQVEKAAKDNLQNLRSSYEIIMCAKRYGMIRSVVKVYEQQALKGPFNVSDKVAASYAFAFWVMDEPVRWDWKSDNGTDICKTTSSDAVRMTYYRDRAFKSLGNTPEVLLFAALQQNRSSGDSRQRTARKLEMLNRAEKKAPNWADLQYWRHQALLYYGLERYNEESGAVRVRYARQSLEAIAKAEKLDPNFHKEGLLNRMQSYEAMGKPREALAALESYSRYKPKWYSRTSVRDRRTNLMEQIKKFSE